MRMLFLVLVARSGAGVAGSELLQRREWPRGVVLGLARERGHGAALAAAHGAALSSAAPQHQLQAVQRNASGLSGAVRRLAGLCDDADPWARDAQSVGSRAGCRVSLAGEKRQGLPCILGAAQKCAVPLLRRRAASMRIAASGVGASSGTNRWSWERLAKTKGGSGGSDINNEGNDHTGRRMTLGKRARERIGENRSPGRTEGGAPGPRTKQVSVWAWCPV
ncbi:hypothetical protein EMIHUDRAFT_200823 [Emiliania huxleyi CCMP1516]|uniref:Secreted protein n=2 Tax=Emiliania huxleyi TaxID=2903 RepID=A0A0D3KR76_EMIH1|nr:hypothetical protein EMIHUDRAFT_200823 [Emiliania huxleyi CCMP1516]EOD38261.1 hypothetical protein EMIHUDRAFT_200823 [Emiliania huxleyi CCMP1516]|eukprot:XP_005790690.1 hypothetical protein EMIHUDRAFT_200823 [Emiliania huxleyi CCMP1516]